MPKAPLNLTTRVVLVFFSCRISASIVSICNTRTSVTSDSSCSRAYGVPACSHLPPSVKARDKINAAEQQWIDATLSCRLTESITRNEFVRTNIQEVAIRPHQWQAQAIPSLIPLHRRQCRPSHRMSHRPGKRFSPSLWRKRRYNRTDVPQERAYY